MEARLQSLLFFFQAEDGIRDRDVTGVQTCALPIYRLQQPAPPESEPTEDEVRLSPRTAPRHPGRAQLRPRRVAPPPGGRRVDPARPVQGPEGRARHLTLPVLPVSVRRVRRAGHPAAGPHAGSEARVPEAELLAPAETRGRRGGHTHR